MNRVMIDIRTVTLSEQEQSPKTHNLLCEAKTQCESYLTADKKVKLISARIKEIESVRVIGKGRLSGSLSILLIPAAVAAIGLMMGAHLGFFIIPANLTVICAIPLISDLFDVAHQKELAKHGIRLKQKKMEKGKERQEACKQYQAACKAFNDQRIREQEAHPTPVSLRKHKAVIEQPTSSNQIN